MKRFLVLFLCIIPLLVVAQVQKVAILETVDREGNISYAHKLMLRSNLAKAITNAPGYEAYDRTDMDAIMGEQNFQRTGMVSNEQIKRLGEMTGAAFILVAEAVKVDEQNMFITAKILNVETARTEATENVMVESSPTEIQYGCESLAYKLLGLKPPARQTPVHIQREPSNTYSQKSNTIYTQTYTSSQPAQVTSNQSEENTMIEGMDDSAMTQYQLFFNLKLLWQDKSYPSACRKAGKKEYFRVFKQIYESTLKEAKKNGVKHFDAMQKAIEAAFPKAVEAGNNVVLNCSQYTH